MSLIIPYETQIDNTINTKIHKFFNYKLFSSMLKQCNFYKSKGIACIKILTYLFTLIFTHKNFYRHLETNKDEAGFSKDTVYRFLNTAYFNWEKLLYLLSSSIIIKKISGLTSGKRRKVFIVDDSTYERNRSKNVELLSKFYDHVTGKYIKGFQMLTLGWSDGNTFVPINFNLMSSSEEKNQLYQMQKMDKRSLAYKRRISSKEKKNEYMIEMIKKAMRFGIKAQYVLFDSWYSSKKAICNLHKLKLHTIAMIKDTPKSYYLINGRHMTLKEIFNNTKRGTKKGDILTSKVVDIKNEEGERIPVKIVFVRNRNKKSEWLALISTNTKLSNEEIVRIYGKRWDIEVFFKTCKSYLKLANEFQSRNYDALVAHTSIVFMRYMMLTEEARNNVDVRTIGDLFYICCDELEDIKSMDSLRLILSLLKEVISEIFINTKEVFNTIFDAFINKLPNYIKIKLGIMICES